ncbi:MAG: GNAT family N-acetyltransferase [Bacteroidales bacterium]|jgi:RimJ/RimL family protein N-acetyltransferase|nr:GNAT family N-acetyltransferase [Bacteroidales bacterium]
MMEFKLRKWQETDLDSLVKHADNVHVARFLSDQFPNPYTHESGREFLSVAISDDPVRIFAIEADREAVGSIGIFPQTDIHRKNAEIGYWLSETYWGRGIMSEAICRIVDYGFKTFDITRIFARPFGSNRKSQHILEKAGFVLEARFEGVLIKNGELTDELIYALRK